MVGEIKWPRKGATAMEVVEGRDLSGKFVLVTGANAGIGQETCRTLASAGAHVTLACRSSSSANAAKEAILREFPQAKLALLSLDLSDLGSVEEAAAEVKRRGQPLHVLVANAGVVNPPQRVTDQGFEATFQVNHLGHFYLVELLKELLVSSAPARVVVVSSEAHRQPNVRWSPQQMTWERFSPTHSAGLNNAFTAYAASKFANVLHAAQLQRELGDEGVSAFSLHPGVVRTQVMRNSWVMRGFFRLARPFTKGVEAGAATSVFSAVQDGLEENNGGGYFADCRPKATSNAAASPEAAKRLWELSEEMLRHYRHSAKGKDAVPSDPHAAGHPDQPTSSAAAAMGQ